MELRDLVGCGVKILAIRQERRDTLEAPVPFAQACAAVKWLPREIARRPDASRDMDGPKKFDVVRFYLGAVQPAMTGRVP